MSIIPGIEIAAPERTETSSGSPASPKRFPVFCSSRANVLGDLGLEAIREVALGHVGAAGVGRDRETGGNREPERCHLGEADSLSAEQLPAAVGRLVEGIHEDADAHRRIVISHRRRRARYSASHATDLSANQNGVNTR